MPAGERKCVAKIRATWPESCHELFPCGSPFFAQSRRLLAWEYTDSPRTFGTALALKVFCCVGGVRFRLAPVSVR